MVFSTAPASSKARRSSRWRNIFAFLQQSRIREPPSFQVHVDLGDQQALRLYPNYQPDDVVGGEGEAAAVLEEDPVERDNAAAAVVLPDLPEALEREEGDDAQEDGARLLL